MKTNLSIGLLGITMLLTTELHSQEYEAMNPGVFESVGNDYAYIKLEIRKNNKFKLYYFPLDGKNHCFSGTWESDGEHQTLKFKQDLYLNSFFMTANQIRSFKVLDDYSVRFNSHTEEIWVNDILCTKRIPEPYIKRKMTLLKNYFK